MLFLLCLYSCDTFQNQNHKIRQEKEQNMQFVLSGEKIFSPNNVTPSDWLNTFVYTQKDSTYFVLYNTYSGTLNYFNLDNCQQTKTRQLSIEDKDGIAFAHNSDVCYVQDYKYAQFFKITEDDKVDTIAPWKSKKMRIPPSRTNIFNGVYECDSLFYFITYTMGEYDDKDRFTCMEFDKEHNKIAYYVNYPEVYSKANWGETSYRRISTCFEPMSGSIIFSFPASHYLTVFNCRTKKTEEFYAGSSYISAIKAYSNKKESVEDAERVKYFSENNSYGAVLYDKYRNLFYRIAEVPDKESEETYLRKVSIIVFDAHFNILGEQMLGHKYGTTIQIVPEGILVPYIEAHPAMDQPLKYHLFHVKNNSI